MHFLFYFINFLVAIDKSSSLIYNKNMKKFLLTLLLLVVALTTFTSCTLFGQSSTSATEQQNKKAILVSFKTVDSDYDGAFNSIVGWKAAGMGYIVKTKSGKIIAIDGGNTADATPFYNELKKYSADNTIDYWIFTHPHGDHVNAFLTMATSNSFDLTIKNLVYDFPLDFSDSSCAQYNQQVQTVANAFGSNIITPQKGQTITLDGVELNFLYTPVEYSTYTSSNAISLIFTIKTENKKVMITGDAFEPSLVRVTSENGKALKCDIIQMPHHFLCDTGYDLFYLYVDAKTLLLPTCRSGFIAMTDPNSEYSSNVHFQTNKRVLENAKEYYLSYDGTIEIEL